MNVYALTGGIGAGKSEVSRLFVERGIPVIDADRLGHEATEAGGVAERAVVEAFGDSVTTAGRIDRKKLAALVFSSPAALQRLNHIVHPAVLRELARRTAELAQAGHPTLLIEAALHAEDGRIQDWMAGLILVDCPVETRVRRLTEKRGMTETDARARIAAQAPPEKKAPLARWIIHNDSSLEQLRAEVDRVAREL